MTLELAKTALLHWDIGDAEVVLAAHRENLVYRVETDTAKYALRLHRDTYRTDAELASELAWMSVLQANELSVPQPVAGVDGQFLQRVEDRQFDLLTWLPGRQLGAHGTPLELKDPEQTFFVLGQSMARLHIISDAWTPSASFDRPSWDADGLVGENPVWGRFWENPALSKEQVQLFEDFRSKARRVLDAERHDFGLIHADLLRENILVDGPNLHLIDFDDGGWGFRGFELATTLLRIKDEPNYEHLKNALVKGYKSNRDIDLSLLPLFIALRACTYVGWIVTRQDTPDAAGRTKIHIENAVQTVSHWMKTEASHV